jgi:hypothetical protein
MIRIAAIATLLTLAFAASAQAATLKADYRFENSLSSSVAGAADLTNAPAHPCTGNGANFWGRSKVGTRTVPVLRFKRDGGVDGPAAGLIAKGSYSVVIGFEFTSATYDGLWRRILDFSNGTSDNGWYVAPQNVLDFYDDNHFGTTTFTDSVWHQVVLTRVGTTSLVSEYLDGNLEASFTDSSLIALAPSNTIFFQDNPDTGGPSCESSPGGVSRIRLYTGALSSTAVAALKMLPPAPAITSPTGTITGGTMVTVSGKNFGPNEQVQITLTDSASTTTVLDTLTTDATGAFSSSEMVPSSSAGGTATIAGAGQTSALKAKTTVTINPT